MKLNTCTVSMIQIKCEKIAKEADHIQKAFYFDKMIHDQVRLATKGRLMLPSVFDNTHTHFMISKVQNWSFKL